MIWYFKNVYSYHDLDIPETDEFWEGVAIAAEKLGWKKKKKRLRKTTKHNIIDYIPISFVFDATVIAYDEKKQQLIIQTADFNDKIQRHKETLGSFLKRLINGS